MKKLFDKINIFVKLCSVMSSGVARQVLGVSENASNDEINKAYKGLARLYHPDINSDKNANVKLIELNNARDALLFPERSGLAGQVARYNEESQAIIEDVLDEQQRKADAWVEDIQHRKAVREEWDEYMSRNISIDDLKFEENKEKAPHIEMLREKNRMKNERARAKRQNAKNNK